MRGHEPQPENTWICWQYQPQQASNRYLPYLLGGERVYEIVALLVGWSGGVESGVFAVALRTRQQRSCEALLVPTTTYAVPHYLVPIPLGTYGIRSGR
jgi:hypothetical protein